MLFQRLLLTLAQRYIIIFYKQKNFLYLWSKWGINKEEYEKSWLAILSEDSASSKNRGMFQVLPELKTLQDRVVYWTYEIVAGGRHRGLGLIAIARRSAEVAKSIISQCPVRVIFKLVDPTDFS